jgi:RNA polymerase sigma factor (sigma-70 family)
MSTVTVSRIMPKSMPQIEDILREHHELVYRTACIVTGNPDDAEDVSQTIFLRLIAERVLPKNPKAYLYRAAINGSLNVLRARRRQVLIDDNKFFEVPNGSGDPTASGHSTLDDLLSVQLHQAIAHLSPRTVEILMLRYVEDLPEPQIAKLLGRSRGTVAVTLFRALIRLRKLLRTAASGEKV